MAVPPTKRRSELSRAVPVLLLPVYVAAAFSTFLIGAYTAQPPHDVKVAIVGPTIAVALVH